MSMQLLYQRNDNLPPLAWAAICNENEVIVHHGRQVECRDDFFVDGAWNGPFEKGEFAAADWFCGTGGRIESDKIVFSTPSHVIGALYSVKAGGYSVSNSLYFLLALNKYHLDPNYIHYEVDFNTIVSGVYDYKESIHVLNDQGEKTEVSVFYFRNIEIGSDGEIRIKVKQPVAPFADFEDYETRLTDSIGQLVNNATDRLRHFTYGMVTTISKGYDAPCCAVIAKRFGCNTAVTFAPEGKYKDDCGTEIAKVLGYESIIERNAQEYSERKDCVEAYYVATGELGSDISFCAFDREFAGNLVFTGDRGDSIWNKNAENRNDRFCFEDVLSHLGCVERRLWLGYIAVPMPLFGATAWTSLYNIANDVEMNPWKLNNGYDRPIPRRIIEEAGVPREIFGIKKHGAGFIYRYDWMKRIQSRMSSAAGECFAAYVDAHHRILVWKGLVYFWKTRAVYLNRIGFKLKALTPTAYGQIANPTVVRHLIPWAGEIVQKRYERILKEDDQHEHSFTERGNTQ